MKNSLSTVLLIILALVAVDLFLNDGRTLAKIAGSANDRTAVSVPYLDNQNLVNRVPDPRSITIDTSAPATVIHNNPLVVTATPPAPSAPVVVLESPAATETPTQQPESVINYVDVLAQPTRDYQLTNEQLSACIKAQIEARRLPPYCPPNPIEYAGPGR